ncbi:MAG: carbohydrate ABC transporter substrate-binding protein [Actinomycetales bacterium]|nr:carbohydrate ABC transporter substrate-binding protein [Actinomycetales bacterium]
MRIKNRRSSAVLMAGGAALALTLAACSPPGSSSSPTSSTSDAPGEEPAGVSTELTSDPVELDLYLESGFTEQFEALQEEFTKQFPNVTFKVRADSFQNLAQNAVRIMSSPDAPDLMRFPTVQAAAQDGILLNLDPYAEAYGWNDWPQGLLDQVRVTEDGARGSGSLYALGVGYNVTGVYYNKAKAEDLGIEIPIETISDLEAAMDAALDAGELPSMLGNADFTFAFPLQMIQNQLDGLDQVKDWIYQEPDATYDLPSSVEAAGKLQEWAEKGYFPEDANAIDYATAMGRFTGGEGLFHFNGDWEAGGLTMNAPGEFGFFPFPGVTADAPKVAMAAPATYVVPATAKNQDEIAFFLNWIHTDETARQIVLEYTGSTPGGPADLAPPVAPEGSVINETLAAAAQVADDDGAIDFLGNATPGILTSTLGPDLQLLITGRMTPEDFAKHVQEAYETELGR